MRTRSPLLPLAAPLLAALLLTCWPPSPARAAESSSALINQALDKQVDLDLNDVLPGVMRVIEAKTGVPIKADLAVWDVLPWGEQTNIQAKIQNQTLRQALGAITQKLGLTFTLGEEAVILQPLPALRRLPNRSTVLELRALDLLATQPMPPVQPAPGDKAGEKTVQSVLTAIDIQLGPGKDRLDTEYAVQNRLSPELRTAPVDVPRNAKMLEALEAIAAQTGATWYPWGKDIVLVSKEGQIRNLLSLKTLTARYNGSDITQVLEDLRRRSGVDFTIEPGSIQKIPADFRNVKVFWDNVSVAQALESLKGFTGLNYIVTDKGITISNPAPVPAVAGGAGGAGITDPILAQVTLENGVTVFIRESQVPPEVKPYLRERVRKEMEAVRAMAEREGFIPPAPGTRPAAPPATRPASAERTELREAFQRGK